ncbi:hypothetical protein TVAG_297560 [Trichomonas vaginalis G3]|uniref:Uncharacterized protein n=1 Tax=Trichomonas vaginalis (strain ATCC PRA-98 / G3) TaxID=412133 RepID=A2DRF1_TRIV3|nr:armadillo (ARM) repeat-containing protein family [Trichomonas vaginalis G3]EAY17077.1 hypothetical protein TVAG_297560 [Trichomonas vaginalis G3]KAI5517949.1 armadillo (ARM) repeat-containing protein family [Trichomonas vaginalis G3]|eukprot:XP_001329300.1 hypothetical protein [Trichomonas vaginalis G3]
MDYKDPDPNNLHEKIQNDISNRMSYNIKSYDIEPQIIEDIENIMQQFQELFDSSIPDAYLENICRFFTMNSSLIIHIYNRIDYLSFILSTLLTTESKQSDVWRLNIAALTVREIPESIEQIQPYSLSILSLVDDANCFKYCIFLLQQLITKYPDISTYLVNNHIFKSLRQLKKIRNDTASQINDVFKLHREIIMNCDEQVLKKQIYQAFPAVHELFPTTDRKNMCYILDMLNRLISIFDNSPEIIFTKPIALEVLNFSPMRPELIDRILLILINLTFKNIAYFIDIDQNFNIIQTMLNSSASEKNYQTRIGLFMRLVMTISYTETGVQYLIGREFIPPIIDLYPSIIFKYQICYHYFLLSTIIFATDFITEFQFFPFIFDQIVEYIDDYSDSVLFHKFLQALEILTNPNRCNILQNINMDALFEMLQDKCDEDNEEIVTIAEEALKLLPEHED